MIGLSYSKIGIEIQGGIKYGFRFCKRSSGEFRDT